MNLTKDQKKQKSQDLASEITSTGTLFFTSYQGLKFVDMADLRATLAPTGAKFRVERNAIVEHAISQAKIEGADTKLFQGPTAIAVGGDIAAVAKALVDFQKKNAALKLRACYSEGVWYDEAQVKQLATIGTKEENLSSDLILLFGQQIGNFVNKNTDDNSPDKGLRTEKVFLQPGDGAFCFWRGRIHWCL